jgi:hypothetical protein
VAASYPSSTKSFTTHSAAQTIASADINAIQDEVVALENGLRTGVAHDLIPDADNTRDLGSAAKQWNDAFLGGRLVTPNLDVDTTGFVNSATQPRCSAFHSATQSTTTSTWTSLNLDSEDFDIGTMHDTVTNNTRVTVPTGGDGLYWVIGSSLFAANATASRHLRLFKNGATVIKQQTYANAGGSDAVVISVAAIVVLSATDYVEVQAFQASGGNLNVGASGAPEQASRLQIVKLW